MCCGGLDVFVWVVPFDRSMMVSYPNTVPRAKNVAQLQDDSTAPTTAVGIISTAVGQEAVQAATRDAAFERLARQRTQAELAAAQEQLRSLSSALRAARAQIREAEQVAAAHKIAERQLEAGAERVNTLHEEIAGLQEQLRTARAEVSRKAALLKVAQVCWWQRFAKPTHVGALPKAYPSYHVLRDSGECRPSRIATPAHRTC